jgi:chorismate dehydratase
LDGLRHNRFDVALLPVIDYQRMPNLRFVPGGCIGCDGPTLTVRIFSRVPIPQITALACDTDSHTSIALARVVLAEHYRISPLLTELPSAAQDRQEHDSLLLIGDKVVCEEPPGYPHQLDLGAAWKQMTGLPFVFAAWMARDDVALGDLPHRLDLSRQAGMRHLEQIIQRHATPRGWPPDLARRYMTEYLRYEISYAPASPQLHAIEYFHDLACRHGMLQTNPRPLSVAAPEVASGVSPTSLSAVRL